MPGFQPTALSFLCLFSLQQKTPAAPSRLHHYPPSRAISARLGCRGWSFLGVSSRISVQAKPTCRPWPPAPRRRDQAPCGDSSLALPHPGPHPWLDTALKGGPLEPQNEGCWGVALGKWVSGKLCEEHSCILSAILNKGARLVGGRAQFGVLWPGKPKWTRPTGHQGVHTR